MFDYDNPWWVTFLQWIGVFALGFIVLFIIATIALYIPQAKYHYEYIDLDNNSGIAEECSYKFESGFKGGQGSPVCILEDGTVKQVKEYKPIYDGKYRPIDEMD
jgi:hypothetical protein